jgi:hypothetical protein
VPLIAPPLPPENFIVPIEDDARPPTPPTAPFAVITDPNFDSPPTDELPATPPAPTITLYEVPETTVNVPPA